MTIKTKKDPIRLLTSRMKEESEKQYVAWLLYCEAGSLQKLLRMWEGLRQGFGEIAVEIANNLGEPVSLRSLEYWCSKYQWVSRSELKLEEDLLALREETKRIDSMKKHKIAEAYKRAMDLRIRQLRKGELVTTDDVKKLWEMFRTELGQSLGKSETVHTINEAEQKPLTPDEDELGREIDQVVKKHYDRQRKTTKK